MESKISFNIFRTIIDMYDKKLLKQIETGDCVVVLTNYKCDWCQICH